MPSVNQESQNGKAYWSSLDELVDAPQFQERLKSEFSDYNPEEIVASPSRRSLLKLMGASMALAGVGGMTGCRRWPERKLAPYTVRPEGHVPGLPSYYATAMELGGVAEPLLAASFDGRPIKIEGNPAHPQNGGGVGKKNKFGPSGLLAQASILSMWDPHRAQKVKSGKGDKKVESSWSKFEEAVKDVAASDGYRFAVLSEAVVSPSMVRMRNVLKAKMPKAQWYEYEPVNQDGEVLGTQMAFGQKLRAKYNIAHAKVVACFDADLLAGYPGAAINSASYAAMRRGVDEGHVGRMYCVDSGFTVTSTNADERLAVKPSQVLTLVRAVAKELGLDVGTAGLEEAAHRKFARKLAEELKANAGACVIAAGMDQSAAVHATVALLNEKLGNIGKTVDYLKLDAGIAPMSHAEGIQQVTAAMNAGDVHSLLILGGNPAYDAPADLEFVEALEKVETPIHVTEYENETSVGCEWVLPRSHYLEAWGDARSWDGTISIVQPLVRPIFESRSALAVVGQFAGETVANHADLGYKIVRKTYSGVGRTGRTWKQALHDGYVVNSGFAKASAKVAQDSAAKIKAVESVGGDIEVSLRADHRVYDGRFGVNGWLQEVPDPLTKLTWDNAARVNINDAMEWGLEQNDVIKVDAGDGRSMNAAVYLMPGQARGTISVALGYGRTQGGYIANGVGFNAYQLRTMKNLGSAVVKIEKTTRTHRLVTTQDHHAIDRVGLRERLDRAAVLSRRITETDYAHHRDEWKKFHDKKLADKDFIDSIKAKAAKVNMPEEKVKKLIEHKIHYEFHHEHHMHFEGVAKHSMYMLHVPMMETEGRKKPLQLFEAPVNFDDPSKSSEYRWGMAVDLNTCIGCNSCVVACQAENNVPIVGKDEVARGREMHWLRIDRYFITDKPKDRDLKTTDFSTAESVHLPVTCSHCETAPCEQVCPVAATTHDSEGLNVMVYNRCIGTRYCSNNCPFKVRRYNYFDWHAKKPKDSSIFAGTHLGFPDEQQEAKVDQVTRLGFNPEVTVRMRGVMEKCTFCLQRIKAHTIPARNEFVSGKTDTLRLEDGLIQPACAQACSTRSIAFGDLNDENSEVSKLQKDMRAYELLPEQNLRSRSKYLARVINPSKDGKKKEAH